MLPVLFYEKGGNTRAARPSFVGFLPFWSTCMYAAILPSTAMVEHAADQQFSFSCLL